MTIYASYFGFGNPSEIDLDMADGQTHMHLNVDLDLGSEEFKSLMKAITEDWVRKGSSFYSRKLQCVLWKQDYIKTYLEICKGKATIILSNDPLEILKYTKKVINADIHSRFRTKKLLQAKEPEQFFSSPYVFL